MTPPGSEAVRLELHRAQQEAHHEALFHAMQASLGRRSRYAYGLVAALLAGAAGTTALTQEAPALVAALAFASPVVAALQQLARPESRAAQHHGLRAQYQSIDRNVRNFLMTEFDPDDVETARGRLRDLSAKLDELRCETPGDLAVLGPDRGLARLAWRGIRGRPLVLSLIHI